MERADREGEAPDLVWLSTSPGTEEAVLKGIEAVVGQNVPVLGGSAADDDISGKWSLFDKAERRGAGVVVSVLFPSRPVSFAYHNGYVANDKTDIVTAAEGRRPIAIDGELAGTVYDRWTEGRVIPADLSDAAAILSASTF